MIIKNNQKPITFSGRTMLRGFNNTPSNIIHNKQMAEKIQKEYTGQINEEKTLNPQKQREIINNFNMLKKQ